MEWDGMERDGKFKMRWNEMEWDGMGWNEIWHGMELEWQHETNEYYENEKVTTRAEKEEYGPKSPTNP